MRPGVMLYSDVVRTPLISPGPHLYTSTQGDTSTGYSTQHQFCVRPWGKKGWADSRHHPSTMVILSIYQLRFERCGTSFTKQYTFHTINKEAACLCGTLSTHGKPVNKPLSLLH